MLSFGCELGESEATTGMRRNFRHDAAQALELIPEQPGATWIVSRIDEALVAVLPPGRTRRQRKGETR